MMSPKRVYFLLVSLCAGLLLGIGGLVYLGNTLLAREAHSIAVARADEELLEQKKQLKADLLKKISDFGELKSLAETFLPDSKSQDDLLAEFYKISTDSGIEIAGITFTDSGGKVGGASQTTPLKDAKGVSVFPITIQDYSADFTTLINYLKNLENNRRKLQITQIELQPDEVTGLIKVPSMGVESYIKGGQTSDEPATATEQTQTAN